MLRGSTEDIGSLSVGKKYMSIELAMEAGEGPNSQDKAQHIVAESRHLFADTRATYHPPGSANRSTSAEKRERMVLTMEARECPNTQVQAERLVAATGHLFEDVMIDDLPPGIAEEVASTSSNIQWAGRQEWKNMVSTPPARPQRCVHDGRRY